MFVCNKLNDVLWTGWAFIGDEEGMKHNWAEPEGVNKKIIRQQKWSHNPQIPVDTVLFLITRVNFHNLSQYWSHSSMTIIPGNTEASSHILWCQYNIIVSDLLDDKRNLRPFSRIILQTLCPDCITHVCSNCWLLRRSSSALIMEDHPNRGNI